MDQGTNSSILVVLPDSGGTLTFDHSKITSQEERPGGFDHKST